MRLQRLVGLEQEKIDNEYKQVLENINYLESLLHSDEKIMQVIKEDLLEVKRNLGMLVKLALRLILHKFRLKT